MGSSQTRDQTCVPCIGRRILNHRTTREAPYVTSLIYHQHQVFGFTIYIYIFIFIHTYIYIYIFFFFLVTVKMKMIEEPGGLQSMWPQRISHNWVTENTYQLLSFKPFKSFLPKFFTPNPMVFFFEMVEENEVKKIKKHLGKHENVEREVLKKWILPLNMLKAEEPKYRQVSLFY